MKRFLTLLWKFTKRFLTIFSIYILPPLLVLGLGAWGTWYLVTHKQKAEKKEAVETILTVESTRISPVELPIYITAMGTVIPSQSVDLHAQVSGEIIHISPRLVPGGLFRTDEEVARIEPRDYELAVTRSSTELENMAFQLALEKGHQVVAKQEWDMLQEDLDLSQTNKALILREPHLQFRQAALRGAESSLKKAQLDLSRTTLKAPFNALVQKEFIDKGQIVSPQTPIAALVGTDTFWVQVSVPVSKLPHIRLPAGEGQKGADARILFHTPGNTIKKTGFVFRLLGDLEPNGSMARVLVTIIDPLGLNRRDGHTERLLLGSYVKVIIHAGTLPDVYAIPREALRENDQVYLMDKNDCLSIRPVKVAWRLEETVAISQGLNKGDRLVTSRIPLALTGQKLKEAEPDSASPKKTADAEEKPNAEDAPDE